ncbi:restriction endonuclease subunit S [Veillonella sp.]|uniref:restriction endonuclease subunit S n=1 Tax=Veillonella sp. TaxID=1926307 RepID=UPI00257AA8A9|nr:restriction endonuclease subunit S [Veillonella sp.]MBS6485424.1 restriction endonuclease subunit S [Veillonella sp.]
MSKEKRRVPKLRFPGFTEDWEQCKLGSIGSTYTGLSGKTKEDFGHGEAQYITYLNVFQNTVSDITMTDKVEIDTTQNEVKYGDVLFTTSSETPEEVGMSSVWLGHTPNIYLNSFCFGFRPNKKIDPYFLGYSLRAPYMRDKIKILAQGISRYNISKNKVMELEISLPNNEEQSLLGIFLRNIDLGITLHQRKLDNLKLKKKALLQKLFPKNGERYPELRFPGFTDAWEQRKLGDLLILLKDGSHGTHKNTDAGVYLLSAKNIKNGRINIMPDDRIISWDDYNVIHKNYELQIGDILLTIVGSIGETAIFNLKTKVTFQRSVAFLRPNSNLNNGFLYTLINTDRFQNQLQTKQVVSAQPGIYLGDLATIDITYPKNILEQEKIYNIFREIENSITLHQRKLDHLQLQKKALLQQMFV